MTESLPAPVHFGNIPDEMRKFSQWVLWRAETRNGKLTKVPYWRNGIKASTTDPSTWTLFGVVQQAYEPDGFSGVGFVLGPPFVGIDFDHCLDGQKIRLL
jgi:putative DNA primase/helicase